MRRATILTAALLCVAVEARAQPTDADSLVKKGLELRREHRDAEALDAFRRAYAASATPRALAQIAFAEQALGKWVEAEADLQKALAARDDAWIARNVSLLQRGLATIQEHLGSIEIAADVTPADVWINGVDLGTHALPEKLRVEAGSVDIELRAPGYETARRLTTVEPGGTGHESVHLVPLAMPAAEAPAPEVVTTPAPAVAPASSSPAPPPHPHPDTVLRVTSFVWLGAGAVALGLGTYFGVRTLDAKSQRDHACSGQPTCPPGADGLVSPGVALDQEARAFARDSTAWFAAGILAVGVGATLFWMSRSDAHPAQSGAIRVAPFLGADRAGAQLGGNW